MGEFKDRGGKWYHRALIALIALVVIWHLFDPASYLSKMSGLAKGGVITSFGAALVVFLLGDRIKIFASSNDEKKWISGFALWVISVVGLFLLALLIASAATPPLR